MPTPLSPFEQASSDHFRELLESRTREIEENMFLGLSQLGSQQAMLGQAQRAGALSQFGYGFASNRSSGWDEEISFKKPEPLTIRMELQKDTDDWLKDVEL